MPANTIAMLAMPHWKVIAQDVEAFTIRLPTIGNVHVYIGTEDPTSDTKDFITARHDDGGVYVSGIPTGSKAWARSASEPIEIEVAAGLRIERLG